jgi:hypothetical protein
MMSIEVLATMRDVSRQFFALLSLPLLAAVAACGVLLDISGDSVAPPVDGGGDGSVTEAGSDSGSGSGGGGDAEVLQDADVDACATPATCTPELLTTLPGSLVRLVASGNALYAAANGGQPSVFRIDLAPPHATLDLDPSGVVPEEFRGDSNIAVDPTGVVFWGTANGLRRRDADAGPNAANDAGIVTMSELGAPVAGVRIQGGRLHYTVAGPNGGVGVNTGHLASCALPLCTDVQEISYTPSPTDVIAIGASRWWLGSDATLTMHMFHSVSGPIGPEETVPSRMATDGTRIFWSTSDALAMFTIATSALVDLLPAGSTSRVNGVAVDSDGTLYVTQDTAVKRCTIAAGKCMFTEVAKTASQAIDVAVDATFLYWGNLDGSVLRLRKP